MAHTHTTACEDDDGGYSNCTGEDNTSNPTSGDGTSGNKPKGPNPPWERRR